MPVEQALGLSARATPSSSNVGQEGWGRLGPLGTQEEQSEAPTQGLGPCWCGWTGSLLNWPLERENL